MALPVVEIPALKLNLAEDRLHRLAPVGMALFSGATLDTGQTRLHTPQQLLEEISPVLEQRPAQSQFDGLQIADSASGKIFSNQSQECFGFPEPLGLDLLGLEFFLAP